MKILIMSDSHRDDEALANIIKKRSEVDLIIHAGDSCLDPDDPLLKGMLVVRGNHDFKPFAQYIVHSPFFICHGHTFGIYKDFDSVIHAAKENQCSIVIHGHTHIPYDDIHEGIRIINPGSVMFNRGSYGFGTYVIMDSETLKARFYHHFTHQDVTDLVLDDGKKTLKEFRDLIKEFAIQ